MQKNHEKIEILYLDKWIIVINKPEGILSVPFNGFKGRTAISVIEEILRKKGIASNQHKPYAVHRLDRETSGVMMFALNKNAQQKIMNSWHKIVTRREYRALTEIPKNETLLIEGLIEDEIALNKYNIGYVPKNKNSVQKTFVAKTHYKIIQKGKNNALFSLWLDTGKKNQIRAHLSYYGYPIVGDFSHNAKTNKFNRLCLHARTLEFIHPFTNEKLSFEIPEPTEWKV